MSGRVRRDIFTELTIAMKGVGIYALNRRTRALYDMLKEQYKLTDDDILNELYVMYRDEKWLVGFDETKGAWRLYITHRVYYALLEMISKERFFKEIIVEPERSKNGWKEEMALESFSDRLTPEDDYNAVELYDFLQKKLGNKITGMLVEGYSIKEIADETGENYKQMQQKIYRIKKDLQKTFDL